MGRDSGLLFLLLGVWHLLQPQLKGPIRKGVDGGRVEQDGLMHQKVSRRHLEASERRTYWGLGPGQIAQIICIFFATPREKVTCKPIQCRFNKESLINSAMNAMINHTVYQDS